MDTGPASYKSYVGLGGAVSGGPVNAPRPQRLDSICQQADKNIEALVSTLDRIRSIRNRFIGPVPESGDKNVAAARSGHIGALEDHVENAQGLVISINEVLSDIAVL